MLFGGHRQCRRLYLGHATAPACAEDRPGSQRPEESQALVANPGDERRGIDSMCRADNIVTDGGRAVRQPEQAAKNLGAPSDAGINAIARAAPRKMRQPATTSRKSSHRNRRRSAGVNAPRAHCAPLHRSPASPHRCAAAVRRRFSARYQAEIGLRGMES